MAGQKLYCDKACGTWRGRKHCIRTVAVEKQNPCRICPAKRASSAYRGPLAMVDVTGQRSGCLNPGRCRPWQERRKQPGIVDEREARGVAIRPIIDGDSDEFDWLAAYVRHFQDPASVRGVEKVSSHQLHVPQDCTPIYPFDR